MNEIEIEYDEAKRLKILEERGLDLADSRLVFETNHVQIEDDRKDYGETRYRVWAISMVGASVWFGPNAKADAASLR